MNPSPDSPAAYADNRDPVEVVEEWVAVALQGRPWEARDCDGEGPCFIERGTARNGDCERFISSPLTDLDAAIIERLLEVARGEAVELREEGCARNTSVDERSALIARCEELEGALMRIATPKRPDDTYNLSREACEQIAKEALRRADT